MRLANVADRLSIVDERGAVDVETVTGGAFGPEPQSVYDRWDEWVAWYAAHRSSVRQAAATPIDPTDLRAPVPAPRQVFGIGLNYRDHAAEADMATPDADPVVFAKFPTSIAGPADAVALPSDSVDFEAEVVVVMGRRAHRVLRAEAWSYIAGLTLGQDLSERVVQFRGPSPQFSLGKSYPGFSPIGPVLVTPDEFADPDDVEIGCRLDGQQMQKARTKDLIFPIPHLIESISAIVPLLPGDLIFTGTPSGVGWTRSPKVLLRPGAQLTTHAEVIGEMTTTFTGN